MRAGRAVEREVKGAVRLPRGAQVAGAEEAQMVVEPRRGAGGVLVREAQRGALHGQRLELEPRLVDLEQVVDGQRGGARAAVRHVLDQPEAVEPADGLADRHRAHAHDLGELLDRQPLARGDDAVHDCLVQRVEGLLGERAVTAGVAQLREACESVEGASGGRAARRAAHRPQSTGRVRHA